jgi:hypothetical protein
MSEIEAHSSPRNPERRMSGVAEASELMQFVAGQPNRPVKAAIDRAVARVSRYLQTPMTASRAEDLWYSHARLVRSEEMDAIRAAAAERRRKVEAGRAAAGELATLYRGVAERLRSVDEDFHSVEIARLERNARALGATAGPKSETVAGAAGNGGGDV